MKLTVKIICGIWELWRSKHVKILSFSQTKDSWQMYRLGFCYCYTFFGKTTVTVTVTVTISQPMVHLCNIIIIKSFSYWITLNPSCHFSTLNLLKSIWPQWSLISTKFLNVNWSNMTSKLKILHFTLNVGDMTIKYHVLFQSQVFQITISLRIQESEYTTKWSIPLNNTIHM